MDCLGRWSRRCSKAVACGFESAAVREVVSEAERELGESGLETQVPRAVLRAMRCDEAEGF